MLPNAHKIAVFSIKVNAFQVSHRRHSRVSHLNPRIPLKLITLAAKAQEK
jgi:hypothetical protein